jgi:primase-polymerase (primpol)-like protein
MTAAHNSNGKEYLLPRLDTFPSELRLKNNWVVWKGKKIPFDASFLNSKASVSDPHSWSSFDKAKTAY